jgi:hypothetical protein
MGDPADPAIHKSEIIAHDGGRLSMSVLVERDQRDVVGQLLGGDDGWRRPKCLTTSMTACGGRGSREPVSGNFAQMAN